MSRTKNAQGNTFKECGVAFDGGADKATKAMHGAAVRAAFATLAPKRFDASGELITPTVGELLAGAWHAPILTELQRDSNGSENKLVTVAFIDGQVVALSVTCTVHTGHTGQERMVRFIAKGQLVNGDVVNFTKSTPSVRSCGCPYSLRGEANADGLTLAAFTEGIALAVTEIADTVRNAPSVKAISTGLANTAYPQNFVLLRGGGGALDTTAKGRIVR